MCGLSRAARAQHGALMFISACLRPNPAGYTEAPEFWVIESNTGRLQGIQEEPRCTMRAWRWDELQKPLLPPQAPVPTCCRDHMSRRWVDSRLFIQPAEGMGPNHGAGGDQPYCLVKSSHRPHRKTCARLTILPGHQRISGALYPTL
jgi:hypothetical protein